MPDVFAEVWRKPDDSFELRHPEAASDPGPDAVLLGAMTVRDDGCLGWEPYERPGTSPDPLDEPRR